MIKYSKLPDNIEYLLPVAQAYMKSRKDVLFAYLFGSLARGKPSPLSDSAPLTLRMKILETKKVIADNATFLRHHYESLTMREYFDFSIREMAILEGRFLHG